MIVQKLVCGCGWEGPPEMRYTCPECGDSLDVRYDYDTVDVAALDRALDTFRGVWDFHMLLPLREKKHILSLQEGGTPLVPTRQTLGRNVLWKDETRNPTLSFKDRPNTVGISVARELGYSSVSIASTGNGAASLAAYAARGGMECHICVPESTPGEKLLHPVSCGAEVILCLGEYSDAYHLGRELSERQGWANLTSTYLNPYTLEGDKTIAYELFAQCGRQVPDWIAVPLGAGPMLTGIYKGFWELQRLGFCDRLPRMIGVQAEGCAPIVRAWQQGHDTVEPWPGCNTLCGAIADSLTGYARDGTRTLATIRRSGGVGVAVSDTEALEALGSLALWDGILAEPASATAAAAIARLCREGIIRPGETAVGIITAHGLKDAACLETHRKEVSGQ